MHYQNLNTDRKDNIIGLGLFHARAWFGRHRHGHRAQIEWCFLHKARGSFSLGAEFWTGDSCLDAMFHFCVPWLFRLYVRFEDVMPACRADWKRGRECEISYHDRTFRIKPWSRHDEWNSRDPWWVQGLTFTMPWDWEHQKTEICDMQRHMVYQEVSRNYWQRLFRRPHVKHDFNERQRMESLVDASTEYRYTLKSGQVQVVRAKFHVERMTWGLRWFPFIRKSRTSIDVLFSGEVGEGTGSWKGGTVGCGWDLRDDETPHQCLRRMERERKFDR